MISDKYKCISGINEDENELEVGMNGFQGNFTIRDRKDEYVA